ncbi:hypothetical protein [Jannaschia sp. R86511]|uniref:hypothetical protein n=1 Tax=Jannaschia sp. R86511 TaxID=3093853 RepID=UPI0036D3AE13
MSGAGPGHGAGATVDVLLDERPVGYVLAHRLRRAGLAAVDAEVLVEAREQARRLTRSRHGAGATSGQLAAQTVDLLGADPALVRPWTALEDEVARLTTTPLPVGHEEAPGVDRLRAAVRPTRYERLLQEHAPATAGMSALLAGASRLARLELLAAEPGLPPARSDVVCGAAGPLLAGYVLWCLRQAERAGARRVYFLARDGEILLRMARHLAAGAGLDLDLRYLEGSRRAWLLQSVAGPGGRDVLAAVLGRDEKVTVHNCLAWLGVQPRTVSAALAAAGLPEPTWDTHLGPQRLGVLLDVMVSPEVLALAGGEDADAAARYLAQSGLQDGTPYALVDADGRGSVGRLLATLVRGVGGSLPAVECYLTLNGPVHDAPGRNLRGYLHDEWRGLGTARTTDLWVAMEVFTAAEHGRVEGYRLVDGAAEAVHGPVVGDLAGWGLGQVRDGLERYAAVLGPLLPLLGPALDCRVATHAAVLEFWERPTPAEVRAWGDFPFESDADTYLLAEPFTTREVWASVRERRLRFRRRGTWPAGTLHSSPWPVRLVRRAADDARSLRRRLRP